MPSGSVITWDQFVFPRQAFIQILDVNCEPLGLDPTGAIKVSQLPTDLEATVTGALYLEKEMMNLRLPTRPSRRKIYSEDSQLLTAT